MTDFARAQEEICKETCAAMETVKLAPKETLTYELFKLITLEEISGRAYEEKESQYALGVSILRFQAFVDYKLDLADSMVESVRGDMSITGGHDDRLTAYMGIRDACKIVEAIISKTLGHWVNPEIHD